MTKQPGTAVIVLKFAERVVSRLHTENLFSLSCHLAPVKSVLFILQFISFLFPFLQVL